MSKWTGWGLLLWFILFPDAVKNGILKGLELGGRVLVPSIFPYLVASGVLVKTGALGTISQKLTIGKFSKTAREMLIPSLFCGYPTGARLSALAYDNGSISKKEFRLLFMFANIPGFGFSVAYLGSFFPNTSDGFLIYLSFLFASLSLIWFFAKKIPKNNSEFLLIERKPKNQNNQKNQKTSDALVESVNEGATAMVTLLFFVCFFSSLVELAKNILPDGIFPMCASFLEITTGISLLAENYPAEVMVFFCGFSGLSVMFQSLYFDKNHAVNFLHLFLGRTVYGILSVCYFIVLRLLV